MSISPAAPIPYSRLPSRREKVAVNMRVLILRYFANTPNARAEKNSPILKEATIHA
jgi:hypothetical protein